MDLGETVSSRQSHSSVSLILASLFIFVFCLLTLLISHLFASLRSWEEGDRSPTPILPASFKNFCPTIRSESALYFHQIRY